MRIAILWLCLALAGCRTARTQASRPSQAAPARGVVVTPLPPGQKIQFDFAPAAGKAVLEQSRLERAEVNLENKERHAELVVASLESRFERTAEGWTVAQRIPGVTISRDGKVWEDPLVSLITRFPIKAQLSSSGGFVSLLNPDDAREAVKKTFPNPIEQGALLRYFTPDALETQARKEWNAKYAGIVGASLAAGSALYTLESVGLTTGQEVRYVMERTLVGTAHSEWGDALVFSIRCLAKAEDASDRAALDKVLAAEPGATPETTSHCEGQQVLARAPFVPVKSWLSFRAAPEPKESGKKVEVTLERDQSATEVE